MNTVDIGEAQARLSELISEVAGGGEVVIADDFDAPLEDFAPYER